MAVRKQNGIACPRCQPGSGGFWNDAEPSWACLLERRALCLGLQRLDLQTQMSPLSSWRLLGQYIRTDSSNRSGSGSSSSEMKSLLIGNRGLWRLESGDQVLVI